VEEAENGGARRRRGHQVEGGGAERRLGFWVLELGANRGSDACLRRRRRWWSRWGRGVVGPGPGSPHEEDWQTGKADWCDVRACDRDTWRARSEPGSL